MDLRKADPKFWTFLILISIGIILFCSYLVVEEIYNAKKECNNIGGKYDFKFPGGHLCDGKKFVKFNYCQVVKGEKDCNLIWMFEDSIDSFGNIKVKLNASEFVK